LSTKTGIVVNWSLTYKLVNDDQHYTVHSDK